MTKMMLKTTVNTGFSKIDSHLIKFKEISAQLEDILKNKTCSEDLSKLFYKILFNAEDYFLEVELLLNKLKYSKIKEQRAFHRDFIEKIKEIEDEYNKGADNCCLKLYDLLEEKCLDYFNPKKLEIFTFLKGKSILTE